MSKLIVSMLTVVVLFAGCSKDDDDKTGSISPEKLITPELESIAMSSGSAFTGALTVLPCHEDTSIYFGNFSSRDALSPVYATYTIGNGSIVNGLPPVKLPLGNYNMLYWGVPKNSAPDSTYGKVAIMDPALRIGTNLEEQYFALRKESSRDTTYYPVYDFVYAVNPVEIGVGKLKATLKRTVAGLKITLVNRAGAKMDPNIASARILIGSIADKLNYYTAVPEDFSKTVAFPLTMSTDSLSMSPNSTVMVFPSGESPLLTIQLVLKNGNVKKYQKSLANPLIAGNRLNLTVTLGDLFSEETSSDGFEVENWTESSETIDFPNG